MKAPFPVTTCTISVKMYHWREVLRLGWFETSLPKETIKTDQLPLRSHQSGLFDHCPKCFQSLLQRIVSLLSSDSRGRQVRDEHWALTAETPSPQRNKTLCLLTPWTVTQFPFWITGKEAQEHATSAPTPLSPYTMHREGSFGRSAIH